MTFPFKHKRIKTHSVKGGLRKRAGQLHFQLLKLQRGEKCEISNRASNGLGRFHIFPVSRFPRLEFCEWNILLENWHPTHSFWHHFGPMDRRNLETVRRIEAIKGKPWDELELEARIKEKIYPKHDEMYLRMLIAGFENELGARGEGK